MAAPGTPTNFNVQSANQQILLSWNLSSGADSYIIQRSEDNVTYAIVSTISGTPLALQYLDTAVILGTQYYYKIAAQNGTDVSPYTNSQSSVAVPTAEMCLSQIRLQAQQRADRVNNNFVTMPEWNQNINKAMFELYDLLITVYEDYFLAPPISFQVNGSQFIYPLPNGSNSFQDDSGATIIPRPYYKLMGVDLCQNSAQNGYITLNRFNFIDRNRYFYPNSGSTIYGVFNPQYRVMGSNIHFMPTPSGSQVMRLWYIPRLKELLLETDTTDTGISGWIEYVIVRAAKYALDKEESDTSKLTEELMFLKQRIEESAANRDAGQPNTISDVRRNTGFDGGGFGGSGSMGGF